MTEVNISNFKYSADSYNNNSFEKSILNVLRILRSTSTSNEEKLTNMLECGSTFLECDIGVVSEIENIEHKMKFSYSVDGEFKNNPTSPISLSKSMLFGDEDSTRVITIYDKQTDSDTGGKLRVEDDFEFQSYIGCGIVVNGEEFGAVYFTSGDEIDFCEEDKRYMTILSQLIGHKICTMNSQAKAKKRQYKLEDMSEIMSHDIRNPLTVINGYIDIIDKEYQTEYTDKCQKAINRIDKLVDDMIVLTSTKGDIKIENIDVKKSTKDVWKNIDQNDINIQYRQSANLMANETQFKQMIKCLIENTIEHTNGDVTFYVDVNESTNEIIFGDDGCGIDQKHIQNVFDGGYSTSPNGNGLGLKIVDEIVQEHGWNITVESNYDDGTEFRISNVNIR